MRKCFHLNLRFTDQKIVRILNMKMLVILWLINGHQTFETSSPIPVNVCEQMAHTINAGRTVHDTKNVVVLNARCK